MGVTFSALTKIVGGVEGCDVCNFFEVGKLQLNPDAVRLGLAAPTLEVDKVLDIFLIYKSKWKPQFESITLCSGKCAV